MKIKAVFILISFCLLFSFSCKQKTSKVEKQIGSEESVLDGSIHNIVIIMDTIDKWSSEARDGFKETMDKLLAEHNSKAEYSVYDTELNPDKIPEIIKAVREIKPDLICTINYPDAFADIHVAKELTDPKYKFVSMNPIPVQAGLIDSWEKPGTNITGVCVFTQMNSPIRLIKRIFPKLKKLIFYSWDRMTLTNEWFEEEIKRACSDEGIELFEFRKVSYIEDELELFREYEKKGEEFFFMAGISAFIHKDGSFVNATKIEAEWIRDMNIISVDYDLGGVEHGKLAGTCVIWDDIGAQLAEKGLLILKGEDPGNIPWEYPRKYNIILNQKSADTLGIKIPQEIINASYRIYTDYEGNFIGQEK